MPSPFPRLRSVRLLPGVIRACLLLLTATLAFAAGEDSPVVPPPLASLESLRGAGGWDLTRPRGLSLDGTVTFVAPAQGLLVLQVGEAAVAIHGPAAVWNCRIGDRVHVTATRVYPELPSVPGFPFRPTAVEVLPSFQLRDTGRQDYVERLRAYVVPPQSGPYRFWISSDDSSELWLSADDDPAHARKIAGVPGWTEWEEWTRFSSQQSGPVELLAGKRYYLEVRHEQSHGADHVLVGWSPPGRPRAVIGGEYLHPYASPRAADGEPAPHTAAGSGVLRDVWYPASIASPADLQPDRASTVSFECDRLTVVPLGAGTTPTPISLNVGQSVPPEDNFRWAEIVAEIRSFRRVDDGLDLDLFDGENRMTAHVEHWLGTPPSEARGYLVRLTGACEMAYDPQGRSIPGRLWIEQMRVLPIAGASPTWNRVPRTQISELTRLNTGDDVPVRVRGRVVAQSDAHTFTLEDEGTFSAYTSADGRTWRQLGDDVHVAMRDPVMMGLTVTSHGGPPTRARFDHVTGWGSNFRTDQVGTAAPGSVARPGGAFLLTGSGHDIWDWQDDCFFVHGPSSGQSEFVAHLADVQVHDVWAKAGIMIRQSLAPDSPFVDLVNVGGNRLSVQWRSISPHRATLAVYSDSNDAPRWLKLVRHRFDLSLVTREPAAADPGHVVEAFGYLRRTPTGMVLNNGFLRPIRSPAAGSEEDQERPLIDVRSLATWGRSSLPNYFRLRGVVTCNDPSGAGHYFAIQDATGGAFLYLNNSAERQTIHPGTLVDVFCDPIITGYTEETVATKVVPVGPAAMPDPIHHPMELLGPSKGNGQWIEVDGIVYAVQWDGATIRAGGSNVRVHAEGMTWDDWARLVDHRVRVQGVAVDGRNAGLQVLVPGASYVENIGYELPSTERPRRSIAEFSSATSIPDPAHRVAIVGTLTFVHHQLAIVDDGSGAASVELSQNGASMKPGDKVEVFGFPVAGANGTLTLLYASIRRLGEGSVPAPLRASAPAALDGTLGERLVTFDADVISATASETGDVFELQSDGRKFRAWCPTRRRTLEGLREGSRIRVTGFAYQGPGLAPSEPVAIGDRTRTVQFIIRSPDDIIYLQAPPWLRLKRTLYTVAALAGALLIVAVWSQVLRRRVKQRTEQLNTTLAELRRETELAATLTERQRLAGEIHDSLEQGISGIMLQLDAALQSPACPADIRETIQVARNMVSFSHAEIRHAIWDLHSAVLDGKNLPTALQHIAQLVGAEAPAIEVTVHGTPVVISPEYEHHLLRIAQEAVTNAVKHAQASTIAITLQFAADAVTLRVKDNGCGFSTETHRTDTTHFGLRSLRRRAKKMNARLSFQSAPREGTVVEVVVPLAPAVVV